MGKGTTKCKSFTVLCNGQFPFALPTFTWTKMVNHIYTEFSMENDYIVGVENGPAFKAWFTGME